MTIQAQYTDIGHTQIKVVLGEGDALGNFTGPVEFFVGMAPGNKEHDALQALVAAGSLVVADFALPPVDLAAYAKDARDAKENGGITVQGVPIATDDRSKLLVAGARMRAQDNPTGTEMWSAADGKEYPLPSAAIVLISQAIGAHVSACFACYAATKAALAATPPTITDQAGVDAAFAAVSTAY